MRTHTIDSKTKVLLAQRAQHLRAHPSWPEQLLWQHIRSGQLGVPFRRQVVLDRFIVDFVAPRAKLIVEVDGSCHQFKRSADARRGRKLARLGYRVLRLEAQLVLRQPDVALARICQALAGS